MFSTQKTDGYPSGSSEKKRIHQTTVLLKHIASVVQILDKVISGISTNNQKGVCFNRVEEVALVSD